MSSSKYSRAATQSQLVYRNYGLRGTPSDTIQSKDRFELQNVPKQCREGHICGFSQIIDNANIWLKVFSNGSTRHDRAISIMILTWTTRRKHHIPMTTLWEQQRWKLHTECSFHLKNVEFSQTVQVQTSNKRR